MDFPAIKFDTREDQRDRHLLKEQRKGKGIRRFPFLSDHERSREPWILKDDTVNKGRLQLEMRFFFLRNNYLKVPTNAGGVSYGRTGRTPERAGSGSHLDEEKRTVRAPRSRYIPVWEINLRGSCYATRSLPVLRFWEKISRPISELFLQKPISQ